MMPPATYEYNNAALMILPKPWLDVIDAFSGSIVCASTITFCYLIVVTSLNPTTPKIGLVTVLSSSMS